MHSIHPRFFLICILTLCLVFLIAACNRSDGMPDDARAALEIRVASIASSAQGQVQSPINAPVVEIVRAWQGEPQPELQDSEVEIWCVEVNSAPLYSNSSGLENMIWLVVRQNRQSNWEAMPLMVMSSIWPSRACGLMP